MVCPPPSAPHKNFVFSGKVGLPRHMGIGYCLDGSSYKQSPAVLMYIGVAVGYRMLQQLPSGLVMTQALD